jgi:hypothetical protein
MPVSQRYLSTTITPRRLSAGITSTTSRVTENGPTVSSAVGTALVNRPMSLQITRRQLIASVTPVSLFLPQVPSNALVLSQVNKSLVRIERGQPVAKNAPGTGVVPANGNDNLKNAIGLALSAGDPEEAIQVQVDGIMTLSDWTDAVGSTNLSTNAKYFLSTTDGMLVTVPPSSSGQVVQVVARAVSQTSLVIEVADAVLL